MSKITLRGSKWFRQLPNPTSVQYRWLLNNRDVGESILENNGSIHQKKKKNNK